MNDLNTFKPGCRLPLPGRTAISSLNAFTDAMQQGAVVANAVADAQQHLSSRVGEDDPSKKKKTTKREEGESCVLVLPSESYDHVNDGVFLLKFVYNFF